MELGVGSIAELEAALDILEADTLALDGARAESGSGIGDADGDRVTIEADGDPDLSAFRLGGDGVLDRVFDQGLEGEDGNGSAAHLGVDIDVSAEPDAQPQLFNLEISFHDGQFLLQWDVATIYPEKVAQDIGEIQHGAAGTGGFAGDDAIQGIESVEQEMGVDLGFEGAKFSFGDEVAHFGFAEVLDVGGDLGGEAFGGLEVFTEVAPTAAARTEHGVADFAGSEPERDNNFDAGLFEGGTDGGGEVCDGLREADLAGID